MRSKEELLNTYDIKSWQSLHIKQLTIVRNLFIILSTATTGFIASLLFPVNQLTYVEEVLLKISGVGFIIPIAIGIWTSINESKNYRLKYEVARLLHRVQDPVNNDDFKIKENDCTQIENLNRVLFSVQLWSFLIFFGVLLSALIVH